MKTKHTFVICAYKESPFLEEAVISLKEQSVESKIITVSSTPNRFIKDICDKYKIPFIVNSGEKGIGNDWNFALEAADTPLVTLCHQDDFYFKNYLEEVIKNIDDKTLIAFTDYYELKGGRIVSSNLLLNVKRIMLSPLLVPGADRNIFLRRRILSLGCPICCPSVTYNKTTLKDARFSLNFKCNLDWDFWERISKFSGRFKYIAKPMTVHRIHVCSETTKLIGENVRGREDLEIYRRFWPGFIADFLYLFYSKSQDSNSEL